MAAYRTQNSYLQASVGGGVVGANQIARRESPDHNRMQLVAVCSIMAVATITTTLLIRPSLVRRAIMPVHDRVFS